MHMVEISKIGPPIFVKPEHVSAIRPCRQGEAGESVVILSSGVQLISHYDVGHLRALIARDWPLNVEPPPFDDGLEPPNSEQRAVIDDLYERVNRTA